MPSTVVGILFLLLFGSIASAYPTFDVPGEEEKCEVQRRWLAGDPKIVELETFRQRNESEKAKVANATELTLIVSRPEYAAEFTYIETLDALCLAAPNLRFVRIFGGTVEAHMIVFMFIKRIIPTRVDITGWTLKHRSNQTAVMERLRAVIRERQIHPTTSRLQHFHLV
ncbi:hypothetical protein M3Y99_01771900 [Aphelenchoides fujianensis]|nr:hypothetical protein M3Y99_01771900 [Aphelenchoides fujianensis]